MLGYEKGQVIGHGSFSRVHTAIHQSTGQKVALKKIRCTQGINPTALRELKLLREMDGCSPYVIRLLDAFLHKHKIILVLELMACDVQQFIASMACLPRHPCSGLPPDVTKALMRQLLEGLASIHAHGIVHRDIKSDNLLLCGKQGCLKIADFGLARSMVVSLVCCCCALLLQVCARWYRSPELLFGACNYDAGVDVWAAGCVFAEMLLGRVWLPGMSDMGQLTLIYAALGAPSEDTWPGVSQLKTYVPGNVQSLFPGVAPDALDLLQHLVRLNPADRITAQSALGEDCG
ncbi:Pkinase-domain-containing protein [Haematococcus lacustris]